MNQLFPRKCVSKFQIEKYIHFMKYSIPQGGSITINTLNISIICYNMEKCYIQNLYGMKVENNERFF